MSDPAIATAYARVFARTAVPLNVQRVVGTAPRTALISALVPGVVSGDLPDTTAEARTGTSDSQGGAITQNDRSIIVLAADLAAKRFPLPLAKDGHRRGAQHHQGRCRQSAIGRRHRNHGVRHGVRPIPETSGMNREA